MVTISNHAYYGGGMKINPYAKINQENLSILVINNISKWKILGLFLTVFTGKHTVFKEVTILSAKDIKIQSEKTICYQVDGQTATCNYSEISKNTDAIKVLGVK